MTREDAIYAVANRWARLGLTPAKAPTVFQSDVQNLLAERGETVPCKVFQCFWSEWEMRLNRARMPAVRLDAPKVIPWPENGRVPIQRETATGLSIWSRAHITFWSSDDGA